MAGVTLDGVTKRFAGAAALSDVTLDIPDGAFVAVLGPSGCGKTTLLRLIAGFERPDAGTIGIGGHTVAGAGRAIPPEDRRFGMVFQSYALWPHMSVAENVGYALRVAGADARTRAAKVAEALEAVELGSMAERRPEELSGGQRQRVALARCLAQDPALVLLDEPLANLDAQLRDQMQESFAELHRRTRATMIYVTHDQAEALALADLVVVLDAGRVQQVATPRRVYAEPATPMVAEFIGNGTVVPVDALHRAPCGAARGRIFGHGVDLRGDPDGRSEGAVCLRAEDVALAEPEAGAIPARVSRVVFQGHRTRLDLVPLAAGNVSLRCIAGAKVPNVGDIVHVRIRPARLLPV